MKVEKSPFVCVFPSPVVLVTCSSLDGRNNIITLAWAANICTKPPTIALGIRPERYSYKLIEETKEFVVNIPSTKLLRQVDFCGMTSGKDVDKFKLTKLTPEPSTKVRPPLIKECPVNAECILKQKIIIGVHDLFLGEIVVAHVDREVLNEKGRIEYAKVMPIAYNLGEYWSLSERIGSHGFTEGKI